MGIKEKIMKKALGKRLQKYTATYVEALVEAYEQGANDWIGQRYNKKDFREKMTAKLSDHDNFRNMM